MTLNRKLIKELYKNHDAAHTYNHIEDVYRNAVNITSKLGLKMNNVLLNAIMFHDVMAAKDRDNHHNTGAKWVLDNAERYNIEDAEKVAQCIREHRASYAGAFSSIESEILSSADRGKPDSAMKLIERSYQYARTKQNKEHSDAVFHAIEHIKEKYGRDGYARMPDAYQRVYVKELKQLYKEIDELEYSKVNTHLMKKMK